MASEVLSKKDTVRLAAEASLYNFIRLVHPNRLLGSIHQEVINWWTREDAKSHQLLLLPRDHMKSALVAYRVAWMITRNPAIRVLYISSTARLAEKQLKFIKDILTSDIYRFYWPNMVNHDEGRREKWTETEISVDHPTRKKEFIRDPTVFTAGLTTVITGLHCDIAVLDDIVVAENARTEEGRQKVLEQYSLLSSIETTDALEWIVGTRYDPNDLYDTIMKSEIETYNDEGELVESTPLFEKMEKQVENRGDGYGEFLWPRQQRSDGKWFGFNAAVLAKKKAQYQDKVQFRAQYYNDPNDSEGAGIKREYFQYFDRVNISRHEGKWYHKGKRLNVFAAIDFAYTLNKRSDYTTIVVVGVDSNRNYFILDIDRFKTNLVKDYFDHILYLHQKWDFRKIRAEATAAQSTIISTLKMDYIRVHGLALSIDDAKPTRHQGNKMERIRAVLEPKYQNNQIWHYLGGNCQVLEEELVLSRPPHDDVMDALASCIEIAIAPTSNSNSNNPSFFGSNLRGSDQLSTHSRFGGIC